VPTELFIAGGCIADAGADDGAPVLDAAWTPRPSGPRPRPPVRGEILGRTFDLLQERKEEAALPMMNEMVKPLTDARGEVARGGECLRWFSEEA
jgi:succinate-semialdehyde dehydrogenase/glutarate-semialdehyde dehydrogenase